MDIIQICTAAGEVNANIMIGFLENNGIKARTSAGASGRYGPTPTSSYIIYVAEDHSKEALKLLKESGQIAS